MNQYLEAIKKLVEENSLLTAAEREAFVKAILSADKQWSITDFKLDRTEKVKRTTAILLEETIEELEQKRKAVEETNAALKKTLDDLKAAQQQLIQSEKMASLGELTAGIAHEIQNPLNFVNNFSEVSAEMIDEVAEAAGNSPVALELLRDIKENLAKINHHGKRADAIVKAMLQHSRPTFGERRDTDLNALCEEYVRLSYHNYRSRDQMFQAEIDIILDPAVETVNLIPQDIGRVIINLMNNAFYFAGNMGRDKAGPVSGDVNKIIVTTRRNAGTIEITVTDNGTGIAAKNISKIFQPFFTTKPTGQGTGLGLSLAYDIIKAHSGELAVRSTEGAGSTFTITLPA
ncbi:sensor histidine kinase [Pollutibacter soli]|uniref:sensor histidine kinase n=1 Tax=Pollutibacter soli TaxID=3034157 RepID=UPI0030138E98